MYIAAALLLLLAPGAAMAWPVHGVITSAFRSPERPDHNGVDIAAPVGTPILAPVAGNVAARYWHADGGNSLLVDYANGMRGGFAHLSGYAVNAGDAVQAGDVLGYVGETGNARGAHLHYTLRDANGEYVNPEHFHA